MARSLKMAIGLALATLITGSTFAVASLSVSTMSPIEIRVEMDGLRNNLDDLHQAVRDQIWSQFNAEPEELDNFQNELAELSEDLRDLHEMLLRQDLSDDTMAGMLVLHEDMRRLHGLIRYLVEDLQSHPRASQELEVGEVLFRNSMQTDQETDTTYARLDHLRTNDVTLIILRRNDITVHTTDTDAVIVIQMDQRELIQYHDNREIDRTFMQTEWVESNDMTLFEQAVTEGKPTMIIRTTNLAGVNVHSASRREISRLSI